MSENVICFDENPQRQNVEEDRRGYGGRFEESDCGSEAWEKLNQRKQKSVRGNGQTLRKILRKVIKGETKEKAAWVAGPYGKQFQLEPLTTEEPARTPLLKNVFAGGRPS